MDPVAGDVEHLSSGHYRLNGSTGIELLSMTLLKRVDIDISPIQSGVSRTRMRFGIKIDIATLTWWHENEPVDNHHYHRYHRHHHYHHHHHNHHHHHHYHHHEHHNHHYHHHLYHPYPSQHNMMSEVNYSIQ
jgi:hypothetical protein